MTDRVPDDPPIPARGAAAPVSGGPRVERSAGGVVVRPGTAGYRVLLIRDPYHKWGLPKGHLEEGESEAEAAVREVEEETGLSSLALGPDLGEIDWTFRLRGRRVHKFCRFFLMASFEGELQPELDEGISACVWRSPEEALEQIAYENARSILGRGLERLVDPPRPGGLPWEEG